MIILAGVTIFVLSETGVIEKANEARFKSTMKSYVESINVYVSDKLVTDGSANTDNINVAISTTDENLELKEIIPNVKREHIKYLSIEKGVLVFNIVDTNSEDDLKYGYWACQAGITVKDFDTCDDLYNIDKKPYYTGQWLDEEGVNAPDFTGFNIARTRYVSYTATGEEVIGETIDKAPPTNWYDYTSNKWANIVVENNGNLAYFVWIPKYEYKVENGVTTATYIAKGTTTATAGFKIPESFTWDMTPSGGNKINLAGFWMSKYKLSNNNLYNMDFTYKVIKDGSSYSIYVSSVQITPTPSGTVRYEFNIGESETNFVTKETNSTGTYTFINLTSDKTYEVHIKAYNVDGSGNVTTILGESYKTIYAYLPSNPTLAGLNTSTTKYVTWNDNDGTEIEGNYISGSAPSGWYDYTNNKWANIVAISGSNKAYFTWIPRYEYRVYSYAGATKTDVNYIPETKTTATSGYKIPESFIWDMTPSGGSKINLSGFWMSKYKLSDY